MPRSTFFYISSRLQITLTLNKALATQYIIYYILSPLYFAHVNFLCFFFILIYINCSTTFFTYYYHYYVLHLPFYHYYITLHVVLHVFPFWGFWVDIYIIYVFITLLHNFI